MANLTRHNIIVAGACNSGKSTLVNALLGYDASLISDIAGTTTDPGRFLIEIPGAGPCRIIDTPGADDNAPGLGESRSAVARKALAEADLIILTVGFNSAVETEIMQLADRRPTPVICVATKSDISGPRSDDAIMVCAPDRTGLDTLTSRIAAVLGAISAPPPLLGGLVAEGDTVVLVMPQDSEAPKDRLILPQQMVIRALLDAGAAAVCCDTGNYPGILRLLSSPPQLVITDSQVFGTVNSLTPPHIPLTSFSILMAHHKCDLRSCMEGARHLLSLKGKPARILIAQACSHVPDGEDIGTVKLPRMLRMTLGQQISVSHAYGRHLPDDLGTYDLVIHCGACMFTRAHVMNRFVQIAAAGLHVTNYGVAIAACQNILSRISVPV